MTVSIASRPGRIRLLAWGLSAALILLPLWAMKLSYPTAWEPEDMPFAFILIIVVGAVFEFALRVPEKWAYAAGTAVAAGTTGLLILGNLAVGFAGSEDNPINMVFFAVPAVALLAVLVSRFRSRGLARAMAAAAVVQVVAGLIALLEGYFTGPMTVAFSALWLTSGLLFLRASQVRNA